MISALAAADSRGLRCELAVTMVLLKCVHRFWQVSAVAVEASWELGKSFVGLDLSCRPSFLLSGSLLDIETHTQPYPVAKRSRANESERLALI